MMWNLPTQATVSTVTTTTTINSRNNANTNNRIVNDTNSILIQSNTATTGTNNRTDNKNTNNNAVNNSKKLLTRTSASTTTPNNNTNSVNANNLEKNTRLIPSSIDEEKNESEKCGNAVKQGAKEKILVLNSEQQKKGRTLIVGDSMLAGLREAKVSRSKRIKVRYFPGGKTEDLQYLILYLKKEPDNIIIHIGINDSPYKTEDFIYKELVNVKETIIKFHPNCKNFVKEANNILKKYNNISKQEERNVIFHNNISASHLHGDGLHLNLNGTIILAGNLLSRVRMF